MELKNSLSQLASRASQLKDQLMTEEATKNA